MLRTGAVGVQTVADLAIKSSHKTVHRCHPLPDLWPASTAGIIAFTSARYNRKQDARLAGRKGLCLATNRITVPSQRLSGVILVPSSDADAAPSDTTGPVSWPGTQKQTKVSTAWCGEGRGGGWDAFSLEDNGSQRASIWFEIWGVVDPGQKISIF